MSDVDKMEPSSDTHSKDLAGSVNLEVGAVHNVRAEEQQQQQELHYKEPFVTRCGLTLDSFGPAREGDGADLRRQMKSRHMNMIAIGGAIGAGFFVGSGGALSTAGPGFLLVDYLIAGFMIFNVVYALGELAVMYPVTGGYYIYASRFIHPGWGFALGWNYIFSSLIVFPLELTVCGLTIQYWSTSISTGVWIAVFLVLVVVVNIFGTLGFAEEEFWSAIIKLSAVIVFMIIAFVMVLGGGPENGRYSEFQGAKLWHEGSGAFKNGAKGCLSAFITASFSFSGTELIGLAAAETRNPTKTLPRAVKQVFWRITIFYILGLTFVGLLVSSDDPRLLRENASSYTKASPFVLAAEYTGLKGFNHFMNAVISSLYAPKAFRYIDRCGRPLISVMLPLAFGLLGFINLTGEGATIFYWLQAFSGLAVLFTWGSICIAHIRFRMAWKAKGHTPDEIPFKALGGVYGSYIGLAIVLLIMVAELYTGIVAPIGESGFGGAKNFFKHCLGIIVIFLMWAAGFLWKQAPWVTISEIDVDIGRREHDWDEINAYRAKVASYPAWRRLVAAMF